MEEKILACNNEICMAKEICKRYKLYKAGEKEYKTHNGTEVKKCGKFIETTK